MSESKCWTLPQKVLDNECRIKKLEEKDIEYDSKIEEIDTALENKLDKITQHNQLYGTDSNGNQTSYHQASNAEAWSIPLRNQNGNVKSNNPIEPLDTVTLQYPPMYYLNKLYSKIKNILNPVLKFGEQINVLNGGRLASDNYAHTDFIEVFPNVSYYFSRAAVAWVSTAWWIYYDKNKNFISSTTASREYAITFPENCKYVIYQCNGGSGQPIDTKQQQFNESLPYLVLSHDVRAFTEYAGELLTNKDIEPVLLWKNPDITQNFSAQNISLPTMINYKYLIIEYLYDVTRPSGYFYKRLKVIPSGFTYLTETRQGDASWRSVDLNQSLTLAQIGNGYSNATANNARSIPVAIYGTNVL